ncbi:MAG: glutamate 5-kinase [Acidobacteriia bacterium]|nr:glutamate 5-kinase [Terriglobia bacterium]
MGLLAPDTDHRSLLVKARRIIVKVGSGVVCNAAHEFDRKHMLPLIRDMAGLVHEGRQVVLVSSGAVTLGAAELGLHRARLGDASVTRACAATGQTQLMEAYSGGFRRHRLKVAQVLLTEDDFIEHARYQALRQTFEKLLKLGAVPVVNENDTVSNIWTDRAPVFRDNDRLGALLLSKLDADALVLLSNVDGLLEGAGSRNARVIPTVTAITPEIRELVQGVSSVGRGGMAAKLDAAEIGMKAGGLVVIANGKTPKILERVFHGEQQGTVFLPGSRIAGKKRWLAFASAVRGEVTINANARKALMESRASLLISGVTSVAGDFAAGQVISVKDAEGRLIGKGIAACGSHQLAARLNGEAELRGLLIRRENFLISTEDNMPGSARAGVAHE